MKWITLKEVLPSPGHAVWCKLKTGAIYLATRSDAKDTVTPAGFETMSAPMHSEGIHNWLGLNEFRALSWTDSEVDGWIKLSLDQSIKPWYLRIFGK